MDLTMPILDGYSAAKLIKEQVERGAIPPVKIIALSGYNEISNSNLEDGFDAFIPKPLNLSLICEALKQLI
jgi:CheY-like chemotaxis protein